MYMDDIKLFVKNKKELETLIPSVRKYSQGQKNGIWQRKIGLARNEKWQMTQDWRNWTTK